MIADFSKKQKGEKNNLWQKTFVILFLFLAVFLSIKSLSLYQRKRELSTQIKNYEEQIRQIEESNKKIKDGIANTDNQEYIEKVAREEENMQKPGEKVVSFIMPKTQERSQENNFINFWTAGLNNFWNGILDIFK